MIAAAHYAAGGFCYLDNAVIPALELSRLGCLATEQSCAGNAARKRQIAGPVDPVGHAWTIGARCRVR
jgi:hypothetical protein